MAALHPIVAVGFAGDRLYSKLPTLRDSSLNDQRPAGGNEYVPTTKNQKLRMKIKLITYDLKVREAEIAGTELTAPKVICYGDKFFALRIDSAAITVKNTNDKTLEYRQCRGEFLSNIELVKKVADE